MPTNIEWTDESWNPVTGCTNISPGCANCYAEKITNRFKRHPWGQVTLHPDRLAFPATLKTPRKIFLCSMGDLFHSAVPWEFIIEVFDVMVHQPKHIFQVLTKRPGRMTHFANVVWPRYRGFDPNEAWPANVWAGTSVESQKYAPRLDLLAQVPAAVRFVSYEPALGPVDFSPWLGCGNCGRPEDSDAHNVDGHSYSNPVLDWVIAGGESGPGARPAHPDWFRSVRDQCQAADVPFFFKQWGRWHDPVGMRLKVLRKATNWAFIDTNGDRLPKEAPLSTPGAQLMAPVGKTAAGATLDMREWREFPEVH